MPEPVGELRREVSGLYAITGGFISAASLISLITKIFSVGLAPVLQEFVDYYRKVTHFFVDWLFFWLPFKVPDTYKDAYVIAFVLSLLILRAVDSIRPAKQWWRSYLLRPLVAAVAAVPLLGFLVLAISLVRVSQPLNSGADKVFLHSVGAMVIVTIAFFAFNSQL